MIFLTIILFIIGICVGSFLNVLIDRLPRGESVFKGRSHCESCKKTLSPLDLFPLFSFIFLLGKCRYCRKPIGWYYPLVELVTGILFVLTYFFILQHGYLVFSIWYLVELGFLLFIVSSLVVIFFTDLKYGIIPDKIIAVAVIVTFLYKILNTTYDILPFFLSGLGAFLFFLLLFLITRGKGMGFGDVKFALLIGLVLGFPKIVVGLYVAFLTGAVVGIILILWRKKQLRGATIPFGPFLVAGTCIGLFWGDFIWQQVVLGLPL